VSNLLDADLDRQIRAAINPLYENVRGTESYERTRLLGEIDRLRAVEAAARNLVAQKGRHHTQVAYERLAALLPETEGD